MRTRLIRCLQISMALLFLVALGYQGPAIAASGTVTSGLFNVTDATCGGQLSFELSPNVQLGYNILDDSFAINSFNDKTDTTNGMEYGIGSDKPGYYQRQKTVDAGTAITAPTGSNSSAFSTNGTNAWTYQGSTK
ncbi:hypothetical protein G3N55_07700 [Dissulfurirhabdus thermomarina]|uniref:PEP-CTERM sorting domain-containing protein n=1 Tax=Dissulfurirhabdus thermomarina TaxID=1765737 RepID=A0A6N9TRI3_DISTH|nr:hypothetical protein [Dissulfurirhabdus thermomarina]NDY42723.1 hypothetical protein [Dissulfurirhabdus thermomarina]NMX23635.1 hypothetical protein [Dissulfurirhabdus thermomarina]